jgi:RNA polymerase sigma-70 factor (ECF subfamily)
MGLDNDASQDLTQNLFYRMIKYRNTYRDGSSVKSWIYRIARNLHTDYRIQQKREEEVFFQSETYPSVPSDSGSGYSEDEFERLNKAFSELSDSQREILVLSRYQGLKYEEISKLINQSVPAIKVAVHRAIKHLRVIYLKQV